MNSKINPISLWKAVDIQTIVIYLFLVSVGWLTVFSASYNYDSAVLFDLNSTAGKQLIWIAVSLVTAFFILLIDAKFYYYLSYNGYIIVMFLLLLTLLIAPEIKDPVPGWCLGLLVFNRQSLPNL